MNSVDIVLVILYLVGIFGVGVYFYKWIKKPDDFYVAGRRLTPFILAATLSATNINLYSFVGQSGAAYQNGISIIWNTWTGNMALVLSGLFIIPLLRRLKVRTIPEFVEMRYSNGFRAFVGIIWIFRFAFWLGVGVYAIAVVAQMVTGVNSFTLWVIVLTVIAVLYTMLGGNWSVVVTDVLQFLLMLGGALILLPLAMKAVGWFPGLVRSLPEQHFNFVPEKGPYNWVFLLTMLLLGIKWASVDQGILQRAFGAENDRTAAKAMVLSGIITTPFAFLWILPGMAAAVLYKHLPSLDYAVPKLIIEYVPHVALGLLMCGLLSAQMSAVGGYLNSVATIFTNDIYNGFFGKKASEKTTLLVARTTVVIVGIFIIGFSYLIPFLGGIVKANLTIVGIMDMPLFVVAIIYGLFWKRANWQGAFGGYVAGTAAGLLVFLFGGHNFNLATFASAGVTLLACPIITLLTSPQDESKRLTIWNARKLMTENEDGGKIENPYRIIPLTLGGRLSLLVVAIGLLGYIAGAILGGYGQSIASAVAISSMMIFFAGGFSRLFFD